MRRFWLLKKPKRRHDHGCPVFVDYLTCTCRFAGYGSTDLLCHWHIFSCRHFTGGSFGCIGSDCLPKDFCGNEQIQSDRHTIFYSGWQSNESGRNCQTACRFCSGHFGKIAWFFAGNQCGSQRAVWSHLRLCRCRRCRCGKHGSGRRRKTGL